MSLQEKFQQIEAVAQKSKQARQAQARQQAQRDMELMSSFQDVKHSIIRPVLEEGRDLLLQNNHAATIKENDEGSSIGLFFCSETVPEDHIELSQTRNFIAFGLNRENLKFEIGAPKAQLSPNTPIRELREVFDLKTLTEELVEDRVLSAIRAVIR